MRLTDNLIKIIKSQLRLNYIQIPNKLSFKFIHSFLEHKIQINLNTVVQ